MGRRDFSKKNAVSAEPLPDGGGDDVLLGKGLLLAHLAVSGGPDQRRREVGGKAEGHGNDPGGRHGFRGLGGFKFEGCGWGWNAGHRT